MVDWDAWERIGLLIDSGSGVAFGILGIAVGLIGPRTGLTAAFATFATMFGINRTFINGWYYLHPGASFASSWVQVVDGTTSLLTAAAMVWLALRFPNRALHDRRAVTAVVAILSTVFLLDIATFAYDWDVLRADLAASGQQLVPGLAHSLAYNLRIAAMASFVVVMAIRWSKMKARARAHARIATFALLLPVAMVGGFAFAVAGIEYWRVSQRYIPSLMVLMPLCVAVWLWHMRGTRDARLARQLAVMGLGVGLGSAVFVAAVPITVLHTQNLGMFGVVRLVAFSLLGYAVLRYQMLDIDIRLKVGIRRSTVAGIVVASFFVVSELVAGLLSEQIGLVAGVLTTGALVFAIAPLQRIGDKLADAALPDVKPLQDRTLDDRLDMYRNMAEAAWSDGKLTRSEGRVLDVALMQLGLSHQQVAPIERSLRA